MRVLSLFILTVGLLLAVAVGQPLAIPKRTADGSPASDTAATGKEPRSSRTESKSTASRSNPVPESHPQQVPGAGKQASSAALPASSPKINPPANQPPPELFTGQVLFLRDALKQRNIESYEEEIKNQVVLAAPDGELIPIVPDWRGRAFYQDERLRNRKVELVGYRHAGVPYLKVLMVYTFNEHDQRQYTDYWCDICSIPMYEIQPCKCCQAPIRLRYELRELPSYVRPASKGVKADVPEGSGKGH